MRSKKEIKEELKQIEELTNTGLDLGTFDYLHTASMALRWALGESKDFPSILSPDRVKLSVTRKDKPGEERLCRS